MVQHDLISMKVVDGVCDYCPVGNEGQGLFIAGGKVRTLVSPPRKLRNGTSAMETRNTVICESCLRKQYSNKNDEEWKMFLKREFAKMERARARHKEVVEKRKNMQGIE